MDKIMGFFKPRKEDNVNELSVFDYQQLDAETRVVVKQRTGEIKELMRNTAEAIVRIGEKLAEVREQLPEGHFQDWLKQEFDWSRRTAYNFISVYEQFGARANFAQINIAASALYLLAAPSTPDEARQEALTRAETGEAIGHKEAKEIVSDHKPALASQPLVTFEEQLGLGQVATTIVDAGHLAEGLAAVMAAEPPPIAPIFFRPVEELEEERYRMTTEPETGPSTDSGQAPAPWEMTPEQATAGLAKLEADLRTTANSGQSLGAEAPASALPPFAPMWHFSLSLRLGEAPAYFLLTYDGKRSFMFPAELSKAVIMFVRENTERIVAVEIEHKEIPVAAPDWLIAK
jgi:hypothetical protein